MPRAKYPFRVRKVHYPKVKVRHRRKVDALCQMIWKQMMGEELSGFPDKVLIDKQVYHRVVRLATDIVKGSSPWSLHCSRGKKKRDDDDGT